MSPLELKEVVDDIEKNFDIILDTMNNINSIEYVVKKGLKFDDLIILLLIYKIKEQDVPIKSIEERYHKIRKGLTKSNAQKICQRSIIKLEKNKMIASKKKSLPSKDNKPRPPQKYVKILRNGLLQISSIMPMPTFNDEGEEVNYFKEQFNKLF